MIIWGKQDNRIDENAKFLALKAEHYLAGLGLHAAMRSYCNRNETDGFVPASFVTQKAAGEGRKAKALIEDMVKQRLLDVAEGGYHVHDYLKYNPSAEKLAEARAATAARVANHRANGSGRTKQVQPSDDDGNAGCNSVTNAPETPPETPHVTPVYIAEDGRSKIEDPDPLHSAGARVGLGSPEADRALTALRSHPNLSAVATGEVARALGLVAHNSGRSGLIEQAIREAAEEAAVQSTTAEDALKTLLRRYVASAKAKPAGASSAPRRAAPPKQSPPAEGAKALGWGITSTGD